MTVPVIEAAPDELGDARVTARQFKAERNNFGRTWCNVPRKRGALHFVVWNLSAFKSSESNFTLANTQLNIDGGQMAAVGQFQVDDSRHRAVCFNRIPFRCQRLNRQPCTLFQHHCLGRGLSSLGFKQVRFRLLTNRAQRPQGNDASPDRGHDDRPIRPDWWPEPLVPILHLAVGALGFWYGDRRFMRGWRRNDQIGTLALAIRLAALFVGP